MKEHSLRVGGGSISIFRLNDKAFSLESSGLKERCPDCGTETCNRTCDLQAERQDYDREDVKDARILYNAAIDGMESLLLSLVSSGKVKLEDCKAEIEEALDSISNHSD